MKIEISRVVISQAKKMGFDEPILPSIKKMIINSDALPSDNLLKLEDRKFEEYIFTICNGVACSMRKIKKEKPFITVTNYTCMDCKDTKKVHVFEDCLHCDQGVVYLDANCLENKDCEYCFGKGGTNKTIPCQSCSSRERNYFKKS